MVASTTPSGSMPTHTTHSTPSGSSTSKPLLFFVALGFGVVFTNLWIIVGVKYCFRYNQRARQGLLDNETGEPIDLPNMARPRRRREKKLMSMEEVNERFPLLKYQTWRARREHEGLPTTGGVTAPPSRAASIKDAIIGRSSAEHGGRSSYEVARASTSSNKPRPDPTSETKDFANVNELNSAEKTAPAPVTSEPSAGDPQSDTRQPNGDAIAEDDDDDDDPIRTAVPTELLQQPGDACAICIDTIEDEDEVRGLTCGHAFHAGCLDPWLTSRRACCPLCKADYFIPKPRPEGEASNPEATNSSLSIPANVWIGGRVGMASFRPRLMIAGSRFSVDHHDRFGFPVLMRDSAYRERQYPQTQSAPQDSETTPGQATESVEEQGTAQQSRGARFAGRLRSIPAVLRSSRNRNQETVSDGPAQEAQATPGQLEAGSR